jgi:hypothetical protein
VSNGALARTSTCIRAPTVTKPIVAIRYEGKDPWRRQHKLGQYLGRPGRVNVLFSTCVPTNLACVLSKCASCRKTHRRLYDHVVFVPFETLRAHPASNQGGPLNARGIRSRPEVQFSPNWGRMLATTCVQSSPVLPCVETLLSDATSLSL